jgi:hypothetical protein
MHMMTLFNALNPADQAEYLRLKARLAGPGWRGGRNRLCALFQQELAAVHAFVMKGDSNDLVRGLVCGIYWIREGIIVNPPRFSELISKSKSSVNGGFQALRYGSCALRYGSCAIRGVESDEISRALRLEPHATRHWTLRCLIEEERQPPEEPAEAPAEIADLDWSWNDSGCEYQDWT